MKHILMVLLVVLGFSFALGQTEPKAQASLITQSSESATVPFSDFPVKIDVEKSEFEIRGTFTLGPASDGINLYKEDVAIKVGNFSATIPAGSFKQEEGDRSKIRYKGLVDKVDLDVLFRVVGKSSFHIKIEGEGSEVGKVGPGDIAVRIGNDGGNATGLLTSTKP